MPTVNSLFLRSPLFFLYLHDRYGNLAGSVNDYTCGGMAWGVLLQVLLQMLFQIPALYNLGLLPRPRIDFKDAGVKRVIGLMLPAMFSVSVTQINLLLDTLIASFLTVGSVSWLYYSDRLVNFHWVF